MNDIYIEGGIRMTLLLIILTLAVLGKIIGVGLKLAWGITKIVLFIIFLPLIILGLVYLSLTGIAFIVLIGLGIWSICLAPVI